MQTNYFRVNKKEFCHITDDVIFIINGKEVKRVPLEHDLSEAWGILSMLNYLVFIFLFAYVGLTLNMKGIEFFKHISNYGALLLLLLSLKRVQEGFNSSSTPTIQRNKIKSVYLITPTFSFPRLEIYFEGPEGKVLKKIIRILYKQEALPVLQAAGLVK